jgi:hypothetical protein
MTQNNWRWCSKCQGLWYNGFPDNGHCPADGLQHISAGSGNYTLTIDAPIAGQQDNWRWCSKCYGLFYNGSPTNGTCPTDGKSHKNIGSGNYSLNSGAILAGQQDNWRWCSKCEGLHFNGNNPPNPGRCPAGGGQHLAESFDYKLPLGPA